MALTTKTIVNDGQFLVVTSSSGNVESINLAVIKNITYTYVASPPGTYNYTDMCLLTVEFADREADLSFDLASITNQVGWTLDEAGCVQAETDIRTWAKANGGGGGGGDATEATLLQVESAIQAQGLVPQATEAEALDQGISLDALVQWTFTGQQLNKDSAPVSLSFEQEAIIDAIKLAVSSVASNTTGQVAVLDAIKSANESVKIQTANLNIPLSDLAPKANTLSSVKTTAGGTIPPGSKAASIFIDGIGGEVNGVERPDGWSQSFEFNNNTLPAISYDGMGTATVYVDILT
jgi:hypothetical protein